MPRYIMRRPNMILGIYTLIIGAPPIERIVVIL